MVGASYYQGDLAPLPVALSLSEGNVSWSLSLGMKVSAAFMIHGRFTLGKLSGDDANGSSLARRERNLSFQSPLREYAIITDVNINHWVPSLDKYGINLYYTTGLALFTFDPQAIYGGEIYRLQPLGTEGQGLPGYSKPYSLTQLAVPFGLGISFALSPRLTMGMEMTPRMTFTDYLDDVSTVYPGSAALIDAGRPVAAILSDRSGEVGVPASRFGMGSARGDSEDNDWYFLAGLTLSYRIGHIESEEVPEDPLIDDSSGESLD